jgi:hypothetical protein
MFRDFFQIDHQFGWDGFIVSYLGVDIVGMSDLIQFPLGPKGRSFSKEISVKGNLSHALVMGLLLP